MKLADFNDLHAQQGLDVVRQQILTAVDQFINLPPVPPSNDDVAPAEPAAPSLGGRGGGLTLDQVLQRYALVEGRTNVFDLTKRMIIKKGAFEALVSKELAKAWFDRTDKRCISDEQARQIEEKSKLDSKGKNQKKAGFLRPLDRYVYLDGSQEIWDKQLKARLPQAAVKLAMGDGFSIWVNSQDRRVIPVSNLVFDPRMKVDPSTHINTFEGLPLTPVDDLKACRGMRSLIQFLCGDDSEAAHWLTCWLAYPLQNLGAKLDTAVLLHSTMEGSGKSLLLSDIMRQIYGEYGATVGQVQLESAWSQWQANKLYGVFEEVVSRDQRYNQVGKIKHLITGKTVRIESKFINGWEETNYMNSVFLSNEMMPWPISPNDRRLLVLWPREALPEKLRKVVSQELNGSGPAAFYHYLLNYDCGDFDEHTKPVHTDARKWLVEVSRTSWETFMQLWQSGVLGVPFDIATTSDIYGLYREWALVNGEHTLTCTKFVLFLSKTIPKSSGQLHWYDCNNDRQFSMFFMPSPPPNLALGDAKELGRLVKRFRDEAYKASWHPGEWKHCRGWTEPFSGGALANNG